MIYQELQIAREAHYKAIDKQEECSKECSDKEYDYDIIKGAVIVILREDGEPVTLIKDLTKANKDVAKAKRDFSIAEGAYKAACARTQATYLDWKMADAQYSREWAASGAY